MDTQTSTTETELEDFIILIDWSGQQGGIQKASRGRDALQMMQEQSEKAINLAMGTIQAMAYQVSKTINNLDDKVRPDEAEIEFGINLDAEAGAMLAKASTGAQITVNLKWAIEQPQRTKVLVSD